MKSYFLECELVSLTGILASIASPLAEVKISIFAISTFDMDYVLVKQDNLEQACEALKPFFTVTT
jgi:hypothetical protein